MEIPNLVPADIDLFSIPGPKYGSGSLSELATFLEGVPVEQFNMAHWWLSDGMAFDDDRNRMYRVADGQCGCVAGHIANSQIFEFHPDIFKGGPDFVYSKLADLFAIPRKSVEFIFNRYAYRAERGEKLKRQVIDRILFVASEKAIGLL